MLKYSRSSLAEGILLFLVVDLPDLSSSFTSSVH